MAVVVDGSSSLSVSSSSEEVGGERDLRRRFLYFVVEVGDGVTGCG